MPDHSQAAGPDLLQEALNESRQRFAVTFLPQCEALRTLIDEAGRSGAMDALASLRQLTHRMRGLAGTIGFPTISSRAGALEDLVVAAAEGGFDATAARAELDAIQAAFGQDLASPPTPAPPAPVAVPGSTILIAEDDSEQRTIVTACLQGAGFAVIAVASGDLVVDAVRSGQPALILLDIGMPGLDGYDVCRELKANPDVADIPVVFMTARATLDDTLAGLAHGADEFLNKPVDCRELVLRIQLLLKRTQPRPTPVEETPVRSITSTGPNGLDGAGEGHIVLIAEDDPDVARIVDAQLRAGGYTTITVRDGEEALAAVRTHAPDLLVLDMMMPRLSGFEVLTQLRTEPGPVPRIMVLSARGREQDVVRAFDLGADDYMTKPFNPQEMMARIGRLLRARVKATA